MTYPLDTKLVQKETIFKKWDSPSPKNIRKIRVLYSINLLIAHITLQAQF